MLFVAEGPERAARPISRFLRDCKPARQARFQILERETGIEPATNSLEGCDSTTELLPPSPQRLKPLVNATPMARLKPRPFTNLPPNFLSLEPMTRIELVTSPLPRECSTN